MKVLRNVSPKSFSAEEKIYFKQHTHTEENLYCLVTQSRPALPNLKNIQMGK